MFHSNHSRFSIALIAGCLTALASPAIGAAQTPSAGAEVHVGQIGAGLESEQVRSETTTRVQSTQETSVETARQALATSQRKLQETESSIRRLRRQLDGELSAQRARIYRNVATRRRMALSKVAELQSDVRRLRVNVMRASIALASATAEGAWIAVDRTGNVLNQSGGASVNHNGRGNYTVQFDTSRNGCANVAGTNPSSTGNSGSVRVTSLGGGTFQVLVYDAGRRSNGGFFLALSC